MLIALRVAASSRKRFKISAAVVAAIGRIGGIEFFFLEALPFPCPLPSRHRRGNIVCRLPSLCNVGVTKFWRGVAARNLWRGLYFVVDAFMKYWACGCARMCERTKLRKVAPLLPTLDLPLCRKASHRK